MSDSGFIKIIDPILKGLEEEITIKQNLRNRVQCAAEKCEHNLKKNCQVNLYALKSIVVHD